MFSVQSKYSKKTKSISLLGFVISNKTCKTWNVQIRCQPSRLSSSSRWKPNSLLPMQKRPMDSSHHRCQIFTLCGYYKVRCWLRPYNGWMHLPYETRDVLPLFDLLSAMACLEAVLWPSLLPHCLHWPPPSPGGSDFIWLWICDRSWQSRGWLLRPWRPMTSWPERTLRVFCSGSAFMYSLSDARVTL